MSDDDELQNVTRRRLREFLQQERDNRALRILNAELLVALHFCRSAINEAVDAADPSGTVEATRRRMAAAGPSGEEEPTRALLVDAVQDAILTLEAIRENWGDEHQGLARTVAEELQRLRAALGKAEDR